MYELFELFLNYLGIALIYLSHCCEVHWPIKTSEIFDRTTCVDKVVVLHFSPCDMVCALEFTPVMIYQIYSLHLRS
jgi:hypothetical protein